MTALSNIETQILDSVTPRVIELMDSGMEIMEAANKAILEQMDTCGEIAMRKTSRSRTAIDYVFDRYMSII